MSFSPFVKCFCPACFEEIYLGECAIVSSITTGPPLKPRSRSILARMNVEPLNGPLYTRELAQRECTECGYLLPHNIERVPGITLSVVGDVSSGKSHYIASLIQQMKTEWISNAPALARMTCLTPDVEYDYNTNYLGTLFGNKQTIIRTPRATSTRAEPLIYNLLIGSTSSRRPPVSFNLMIYDTSGEDFETTSRLVQYARFALRTDAFIYVVDPLSITDLYQQLPGVLQTRFTRQAQIAQRRKASQGLSSIIDVFERDKGVRSGNSLPNIPIAVMLSKADLFHEVQPPVNYRFMKNPPYRGFLDLQDIDTIDHEVKTVLTILKQRDLLTLTPRFQRVKFFATSATGEPPDDYDKYTKVEPCRCLDPALWILHELELNAIETL